MSQGGAFESVDSWAAAESMLGFRPLWPRATDGNHLASLAIHVRDHRGRELAQHERSLEAHYGAFVFAQSRPGADEARRLAIEVRYGPAARIVDVAGRVGRAYELGPEDPEDRTPSVVTWHDGDMFYLLASGELQADKLLQVADSIYR